ncbi:MAG: tetratricopeptide repeat protein, partial [Candidatus Omnitrophica bacterium]|nr:tetratricopeptide repeat protein [Candidatus Omnitrophota bacterium]
MLAKTSLRQKIALITFGILLTILILEIGLRLGGFIALSWQEHRNLQSIRQKGEFRILCLGESTTQNQYPRYLEEILNQGNLGIKFSVVDGGLAGTSTTAILSQLETNLDKYKPDMVVTMMGTNDAASYIPYEADTLRVYKLARLIVAHIAAKFNEFNLFSKEFLNPFAKKALAYNSGNYLAYKELGQLYKKQGNFHKAERAFKQAMEINPKSSSVYDELGQLYQDYGKISEAEHIFEKSIEFDPKNDLVYYRLARIYKDQGKPAEAEKLLKRALEFNPESNVAHHELAWFYKQQRRPEEAEQLFLKAIQLNPKNYDAYMVLARFYISQKKIIESEQILKKFIGLNPKNGFSYYLLGQVYRHQGRLAESEQLLKKALELNPRNDKAVAALATIYAEIGENELAKKYE